MPGLPVRGRSGGRAANRRALPATGSAISTINPDRVRRMPPRAEALVAPSGQAPSSGVSALYEVKPPSMPVPRNARRRARSPTAPSTTPSSALPSVLTDSSMTSPDTEASGGSNGSVEQSAHREPQSRRRTRRAAAAPTGSGLSSNRTVTTATLPRSADVAAAALRPPAGTASDPAPISARTGRRRRWPWPRCR